MRGVRVMSKYRYHTYDGYDQILDNVRSIVSGLAPKDVAKRIISEIDTLEEIIEETLAGRQEQAEEMLRDDFE
tara:strand:- start:604 stop:822 length:219 start_codon:yes stop_codon:yes gene_type:complete